MKMPRLAGAVQDAHAPRVRRSAAPTHPWTLQNARLLVCATHAFAPPCREQRVKFSSGDKGSELLAAMERELGASGARNPKLAVLLQKATREVHAAEAAQQEAAAREEQLMAMLVEVMAPEGSGASSTTRLGRGGASNGRLSARG